MYNIIIIISIIDNCIEKKTGNVYSLALGRDVNT